MIPIMVLGASASGKTRFIKEMEPEKTSLWDRIKAWLRRGCAE